MQVDLVAEHQHYHDHLLPIWEALPAETRGTVHVVGELARPLPVPRLLLVGGYSDVIRYPGSPVVYVEHGSGQSYHDLPLSVAPFYSPIKPTKQHRNVVGFVCPNDEVAARWSGSYDRPTFVVGCPKLDPWHSGLRGEHEPRTVAVTFHWEPPASVWTQVPELLSGFNTYWPVLQDTISRWVREGWHVIATAHPKAVGVAEFFRSECPKTVEFVTDSADVLSRAAILIADNTSLSAEMMSLGRGVVWLNHPAYRRDVEHGGRFWQWPERSGIQVDTASSLARLDLESVPPSTWHPYAFVDGHAAERAAAAVVSLL